MIHSATDVSLQFCGRTVVTDPGHIVMPSAHSTAHEILSLPPKKNDLAPHGPCREKTIIESKSFLWRQKSSLPCKTNNSLAKEANMLRFKRSSSSRFREKVSDNTAASSNEEQAPSSRLVSSSRTSSTQQKPSIDHDEIMNEIYRFDYDIGSDRKNRHGITQGEYGSSSKQRRANSVQRPLQESKMKIVGTSGSYSSSSYRRSSSARRPGRSSEDYGTNDHGVDFLLGDISESKDSAEQAKERVSKTEKIKKLQAKNELYKVEYKRVQKDRKGLKKEIENKNLEIAALNKEIDSQIAETSVLKEKLAEALQQIDEEGARNGRFHAAKFKEEIDQKEKEVSKAWTRVNEMRESTRNLQEQIDRKDQQVEALAREVSSKEEKINEMEQKIAELEKSVKDAVTGNNAAVRDLENERDKLQGELGIALERAASMVKEREDAIAELLKENDEMKALLKSNESRRNQYSEDDWHNMKDELDHAHASLEQAQDRVVVLEEEIESWINRGNEMEDDIERLRRDIAAWQEKSRENDSTVTSLEDKLKKSEASAEKLRSDLEAKDTKFKAFLAELEIKHRAAILDAREQARNAVDQHDEGASVASKSSRASHSAQAMLLQQAVSKKKTKETPSGGGWLNGLMRHGDEEELSEEQTRIKELETITDDQAQEIQKLTSDLVRLRSTYNEQMYVSKKTIEDLQKENEAQAKRIQEKELEG